MASNNQIHSVRHMIHQMTSATHKLVEDMKDEIAGQTATGTKVSRSVCDRLKEATAEFEEHWANGKVDGWKDEAQEHGYASEHITSIDLGCYSSVDELVKLGPEKLLEALDALRFKTRGIAQQYQQRLFYTEHTPLEMVDEKHFAKGEQNGGVAAEHQCDESKQIALMEIHIEKLCEILSQKILQTNEIVEKKQAQLFEEIDAEREDEEVLDIESDDELQQIYGSLKLPMGWDGKPIPYWLYKLQSLDQATNKEFKQRTVVSSTTG